MACTSALHPASFAVHFPQDETVEYYHLVSCRLSSLQITPRDTRKRNEGKILQDNNQIKMPCKRKISRILRTNHDKASIDMHTHTHTQNVHEFDVLQASPRFELLESSFSSRIQNSPNPPFFYQFFQFEFDFLNSGIDLIKIKK
jgi:hypothetical protein